MARSRVFELGVAEFVTGDTVILVDDPSWCQARKLPFGGFPEGEEGSEVLVAAFDAPPSPVGPSGVSYVDTTINNVNDVVNFSSSTVNYDSTVENVSSTIVNYNESVVVNFLFDISFVLYDTTVLYWLINGGPSPPVDLPGPPLWYIQFPVFFDPPVDLGWIWLDWRDQVVKNGNPRDLPMLGQQKQMVPIPFIKNGGGAPPAGMPLVAMVGDPGLEYGLASVPGGGSGLGAVPVGSLLVGRDESALAVVAPVGLGKVLTDGGPGEDPSYEDLPELAASGVGHSGGLCPDPGASEGSSRFLCEDASWSEPLGFDNPMSAAEDLIVGGAAGVASRLAKPASDGRYLLAIELSGGVGGVDWQAVADLLFSSSEDGLVPSSGGGTSNFLRADGSWSAIPAPAVGAIDWSVIDGYAGGVQQILGHDSSGALHWYGVVGC